MTGDPLPEPMPRGSLNRPVALSEVERLRLAELEGVVERGLSTFAEVGRALSEVRDARLYRETHATFEQYLDARWAISRAHGYRLIDAAHVAELVSPVGDIPTERHARELGPLLREDEAQALDLWRELRAAHGDAVTASVVRTAVTHRLARAERERASQRERERLREVGAALAANAVPWDARCCDLRDLDLEAESVDALITDPPYPAKYMPLYSELGRLARRVLKPGAPLVVMTGQATVFEAHARLAEHVDYVWACAYLLHGPRAWTWSTVGGSSRPLASVGWKPILWFSKGPPLRRSVVSDTFTSPAPDKRHHVWQQSVGGTAKLVEQFSSPGDLVLDPFLGSGTTGVASIQLGRRFVGCDVDASAVEIARARLNTAVEEGRDAA